MFELQIGWLYVNKWASGGEYPYPHPFQRMMALGVLFDAGLVGAHYCAMLTAASLALSHFD